MDRDTFLWTLVVFFGASVVFALIRGATRDEGVAVSLGLQAVALVAIVAVIVAVVRRRG